MSSLAVGSRRPIWRTPLLWTTLGLALVYSAYALTSHQLLRTSGYDLVIFDQAVRGYAGFGLPVSPLKGVHNGFGAGFAVLGDHWSPILALLAPFYWIHDGPETLLVAQAVLFAAAVPVLYVVLRRIVGARGAFLLSAAYGLSWPVVEAIAFDFHEAAFVPLLTALLVERLQAGKKGHAALVAFLLLQVKEDAGLLLAGIGLVLLTKARWRRFGAGLILAGLAAVLLCTQVLIPAFGGRGDYYWAYGALGPGLGSAVKNAVTHPWHALAQLWTPPGKITLLLLTLGVTLGAALASPVLLAAVPMLLERLLASAFTNWWEPRYHYTAFIVVILFIAAGDGIARLSAGREKRVRALAALVLLANLVSVPFFSLGGMLTSRFYTADQRVLAARAVLARVPDGVTVEASNNLAPALSARTTTLLWDRTPRGADWVVADVGRKTFPFDSVAEQRSRVDWLQRHGYRRVAGAGDFVALERATG